jgi:hypothetical protein
MRADSSETVQTRDSKSAKCGTVKSETGRIHMVLSFDPETLSVLRRALDEAAAALPQSERTQERKVLLASRILELAYRGETDPVRLRMGALFGSGHCEKRAG